LGYKNTVPYRLGKHRLRARAFLRSKAPQGVILKSAVSFADPLDVRVVGVCLQTHNSSFITYAFQRRREPKNEPGLDPVCQTWASMGRDRAEPRLGSLLDDYIGVELSNDAFRN
jgi:hypothetical protein